VARSVTSRCVDGTECDLGEHGELAHRGALDALGYWNVPVRMAERRRKRTGRRSVRTRFCW